MREVSTACLVGTLVCLSPCRGCGADGFVGEHSHGVRVIYVYLLPGRIVWKSSIALQTAEVFRS